MNYTEKQINMAYFMGVYEVGGIAELDKAIQNIKSSGNYPYEFIKMHNNHNNIIKNIDKDYNTCAETTSYSEFLKQELFKKRGNH